MIRSDLCPILNDILAYELSSIASATLKASTFQYETSLDMTVSDLSRLYLLQLDLLGNNLVLDAGNITLELPGGNALVKHLLDLGVVTALHLGETVVEVHAHGNGEGEENEANLAMLVGLSRILGYRRSLTLASQVELITVDQVGHNLQNHTGDCSGGHDVDGICLLAELHAGSLATDGVGRSTEGHLLMEG